MVAKQKVNFIKDAIFLSYTSLSDFLKCPRSFYLKNIYRNPKNNFKLQIASPYLTLGSTVHDTIKWFLEAESKPDKDEVMLKFRNFWRKYSGKKGGFSSKEEEATFGKRGLIMLENFLKNYSVLEKAMPPVVFPKYNLLDNVILMGNFDYIGQKEDGSLHLIDFKTGAHDEDNALQLYIYAILAEANLQMEVSAASFWYLDRDDAPREIVLDPLETYIEFLTKKANELKLAINQGVWECIKEGQCKDCRDYQVILDGKAEFQFSDFKFKKDVYYLSP